MNLYYPGDPWVDVVGLSIFGYQEYDRGVYGRDRTFAEILSPSYNLASIHGKPIVVAEVGYAGDAVYVHQWASTLTDRRPEFPLLTAVVYYDRKEVHPWPDHYGLPDWRVVTSEP